MKKIFVIFLLGLVVSGAVQLLAQTSQPSPTPTNQKVIQDPAEYNSYIAALNTQDPASGIPSVSDLRPTILRLLPSGVTAGR